LSTKFGEKAILLFIGEICEGSTAPAFTEFIQLLNTRAVERLKIPKVTGHGAINIDHHPGFPCTRGVRLGRDDACDKGLDRTRFQFVKEHQSRRVPVRRG
jgi:hypothetical protein